MAKTPVTPEILAQRKQNAQMVSNTANTPIQNPTTPVAPIKTAEQVQYDILPENVTGTKKASVIESIKALKDKQATTNIQPQPVAPIVQPQQTQETQQTAVQQPVQQPTPVATQTPQTSTPVQTTAQPIQSKTPEQVARESKIGNQLRDNMSKYRTGQELYNAVQGGLIREGTREYNYLAQANPDLVNQYKAYKQDQVKKETINTLGNVVIGNTVEARPARTSDQFLQYFIEGMDDDLASSYTNSVTNNPDYLKAIKTLEDINTQIAENNNAINKLHTDVRASLSSSTPESMVASRIAREAKPLIEKGMYLAELADNAESSMNRIFDANKDAFEVQMEDRNQKRQMAFQLYGTVRAEEIRQEEIIRKDQELQMAMEQARTQQEYEQYKDERDYNFKVAEAMQKAGQWQADYDLEASEYALKSQESGRPKASDFLKFEVPNEDGSVSTVYQNPLTGETISPSVAFGDASNTQGNEQILSNVLPYLSKQGQELLLAPDGTVVPTRLGEVSQQNAKIRGKECAEYVNDSYKDILPTGKRLGSTYKSKTDVCSETTGGIGSIVAWKPNGSGQYGHTGIIVGEEQNNWYVKSSNYTPGTITTVPVPKENIKNFYTPPEIKQSQTKTNTAIKYPNGNIRTPEGTLYTKKEADTINKQILSDEGYKAAIETPNIMKSLNDLEKLVNKYGSEVGLDRLKFTSTAQTEMKNAYTDILLRAKELYNLGVITGPDLSLVTSLLPSPITFNMASGGYNAKIEGTYFQSKTLKGIENMKQRILRGVENNLKNVTQGYGDFGDTIPSIVNLRAKYNEIQALSKTIKDQEVEQDVDSLQ